MLVACLVLALLLMAHEILAILVGHEEAQHVPGEERVRSLIWFAIAPFAAICLVPLLYGMRLLDVVVESARRGAEKPWWCRHHGISAFAVTAGLCLGLAVLSWPESFPLGVIQSLQAEPHLAATRLFLGLASLAFFLQLFSSRRLRHPRDPLAGPVAETALGSWGDRLVDLGALGAALVVPVWLILLGKFWPGEPFRFWGCLALGLSLVAAFLLVNGLSPSPGPGARRVPNKNWHAMGAGFFLAAGAVTSIYGAIGAGHDAIPLSVLGWLLPTSLILLVVANCESWMGSPAPGGAEGPHTRNHLIPRPRAALVCKAIAMAFLGLHLAAPLLVVFFQALFEGGGAPSDSSLHPTHWVLALLPMLLLIAIVEHEWIVRPYAWLRDDRSRDPSRTVDLRSELPEGEERKVYLHEQQHQRRFVRHTFHWQLYQHQIRMVVVKVNLGFEELQHRRVVHAMLAGLREAYHRRFVAWYSPVAAGAWTVKVLVLMVLATLVGDRLLAVPGPDPSLPLVDEESKQCLDTGPPEEDYRAATEIYRKRLQAIESGRLPADLDELPDPSLLHLLQGHETLVAWLQYPLIGGVRRPGATSEGAGRGDHDLMLCEFLPCLRPLRPSGADSKPWKALFDREDFPPRAGFEGVTVRVYHLLAFLLLLGLLTWADRRLGLSPYRPTLAKMDEVMDRLAGRTRETSHGARFSLQAWLGSLVGPQVVHSKEFEPADDRAVELALMHILEDARTPRLPFLSPRRLHLPAPEVTFVFDELDKLGTRVDPAEGVAQVDPDDWLSQGAERVRSRKVHELFANMKNLLSSAPARFVMVGGRNLHDEWLADQTARVPLLTNIFKGSIYLPSLLTDAAQRERMDWHGRIEEYVHVQKKRAVANYESWASDLGRPGLGLSRRARLPPGFVQPWEGQVPTRPKLKVYPTSDRTAETKDTKAALTSLETKLRDDFLGFLTFRSMGNPKKLKELLESFVRPVGRVVRGREQRWATPFRACDHVLLFDEDERFRVQLVASVYRQLAAGFGPRHGQRGDKQVTALFYFSDFLFKFHERAFNWTNLERVDELVQVHRAPDHRQILEELVLLWSERLLHPILNGLYAFRFRSDMAREIEFISRRSKEEMAAFNFTLDESQALKALYRLNIKGMKDAATHDVVAGLGELYEFDQEFEVARYYYEKAMDRLDARLREAFGDRKTEENVVRQIFASDWSGLQFARQDIAWGINRLRLMLQVGMTFERSRNLERAAVEYRDARHLSRVLLRAFLDKDGRDADSRWLDRPRGRAASERRLHGLKHLNILFHATFAEAWVAEKMTGGVDTSTSLVERELFGMRRMLPFAREHQPTAEVRTGPVKVVRSNFSLIMAELHNKAGDLYFFKGRQHLAARPWQDHRAPPKRTGKEEPVGRPVGAEGYLLRAHYHYAMGLHDIRRFVHHRIASSRQKLNIWPEDAKGLPREPWPTMEIQGWSDFMSRVAGSAVVDLAEGSLARVSLFGLVRGLYQRDPSCPPTAKSPPHCQCTGGQSERDRFPVESITRDFTRVLEAWLEHDGRGRTPERNSDVLDSPAKRLEENLQPVLGSTGLGGLSEWLGHWRPGRAGVSSGSQDEWPSSALWLHFPQVHSDRQRLVVSLLLSFAGARMLRRAGYLEDAARELLQVAEVVCQYLWWANGLRRTRELVEKDQRLDRVEPDDLDWLDVLQARWMDLDHGCAFWCFLVDLALQALTLADDYFARHRGTSRDPEGQRASNARPGDRVPVEALYLACSLGLSVDWKRWSVPSRREALLGLLGSWGARELVDSETWERKLQEVPADGAESFADGLRAIVQGGLLRHSYPVLARLQGLKVLVDDAVLRRTARSSAWVVSADVVVAWAQELCDLDEQVQAPLHFTPFHLGVTLAQLWIRLKVQGAGGRLSTWTGIRRGLWLPQSEDHHELQEIRRNALSALNHSLEVTSMRRAYYESISRLYYLYDDFNDRQIHFKHALQMAGWEYVGVLKDCMRPSGRRG